MIVIGPNKYGIIHKNLYLHQHPIPPYIQHKEYNGMKTRWNQHLLFQEARSLISLNS